MAIAPDEFRHALSHFARGVTVVTTWDADGRPTGLTAGALTSVSHYHGQYSQVDPGRWAP